MPLLREMKLHCVILAFACMVSAAAVAIAQTPKSVSVPAGELVDALELLAKQCGVDIIYPGGQLKGLKTRGVNGTLEPTAAFKTLLEGTPLTLREAGGALLITRAASVAHRTIAPASADPLSEVQVEAQREKLSVMLAELNQLEERFYAGYNSFNVDPQYDVHCRMEARTGTHVLKRVCQPAFVAKAMEGQMRAIEDEPGIYFADANLASRAAADILEKTPDYQKNMVDVVTQHPELLELVKERVELAKRYEAVRKQALKGKIAVWD